jgi:integrase
MTLLYKAWTIALRKAGIRYRNPYQTRHTYDSLMLSAGELLPWISSQMGHSTTAQTTKAYARYIDDSLTDAGEKAVKMFRKSVD